MDYQAKENNKLKTAAANAKRKTRYRAKAATGLKGLLRMEEVYARSNEKSSKFKLDTSKIRESIGKIRYWQVKVDHPRKPFQDTPENRTELIQKRGAMFFSTPALSEPYDDSNPDKEIFRYDDFIWDFDNEKNPEKALHDLRLLIQHLAEMYGIDPYCLKIFCSGKKGFHLEIPAACFGSEVGDIYLPRIYKRTACQLVESLGLTTVDLSIYNMKSGKPFRNANVQRDNGRYKVPLSFDEVQSMPIEDLLALADAPREIESVDSDADCPDLTLLYQEHKAAVHREVQEDRDRPPADPELMKRLNGQLPPCITLILLDNPDTPKCTFNMLTVNIVKYFQGSGFKLESAINACGTFFQKYSHSTTYTTPKDREKHFREQWRYHEGHGRNQFSCGYMLGMGLKGSAFECKECPGGIGVDTGNQNAEPWDDPLPLNCELLPVMAFNPEWLPEPLRDWVKDIAYRIQCPTDYVAVGAMVAYSAMAGKRLGIHPKRFDDWVIVPNLWGCAIGRPSAKKTPALQEVLKPMHRLEYDAKSEYEAENRDWMTRSAIAEMKTDAAKDQAKKLIKSGKVGAIDEATTLLQKIEFSQNIAPPRKRYVINDASIEKEGEILAENPNGILLYRDELFGFLKTINREDKANDRAFHLECWGGLGRYTYDRIGRGTIDIENCIESILGCLTPSKLIPLVNMAMTGGVDDDGFIQRFQLMVYPDDVQFKYIDEIPDKDARDEVYDFFKHISGLSFEPGEYEKIPCVHFSKEAQIIFSEWLTALEMEISSDDIHPAIESHFAKYRSLIPSLALLIHIGSFDDPAGDVQLESLEKAISWGEYLKSHALRVYGLAINNAAHLGKLLLDKIRAGKLTDPFVIRDAKRPQWHGLTSEGSVESALKVLVDAGYLRIKTSPTGGKEKTEYFINPKIISENAQNKH